MINTYNETDLHKTLKEKFCPPDGQTEVPLLGSICDILCKDGTIIEIQTSKLTALRLKLEKFLKEHYVEIIYPIIVQATICKIDKDGNIESRRKSPKKGVFFQVFRELAGLYHLFETKKLKLKILYITAEVIKSKDFSITGIKRKNKHNRAGIINKRLVDIIKIEEYNSLKSICKQVLDRLPNQFTNSDVRQLGAGKYSSYTTWFLRKTNFIVCIGKNGRYNLYKKQNNI